MAAAGIIYREFRYIVHDHSIEVYVRLQGTGDCPIGVTGWHYKHFVDGIDIDTDRIKDRPIDGGQWSANNISLSDCVMWPQKAPSER